MKRWWLSALLLLSISANAGVAQNAPPTDRPRVGLALGGGGARGAAHIGVLKVLDDLGVAVDYLVGTSMGAVVGGLYASGMSAAEIERELAQIDWQEVFDDRPERRDLSFRRKQDDREFLLGLEIGVSRGGLHLPAGLVTGQNIRVLLQTLTLPTAGIEEFDDLPIPFRAVATDVGTGEMVLLDSGDLAEAILASMAVPGAISPVRHQGRLLVDGGVVNNLPIDVARAMGADIVIAVDVGGQLESLEAVSSALDISTQVITIFTRASTRRQVEQLRPDDVLIAPALGEMSSADFVNSLQAIAAGERAASEKAIVLDRLRRERDVAQPSAVPSHPVRPDEVRIENNSRVATSAIERMLHVRAGVELDLPELRRDLARIYGLGGLEEVSFRLARERDRDVLVISVVKKPWGANTLRFGLALSDDFRGAATYHLRASLVLAHLNRLGGEARLGVQLGQVDQLSAEFFQPVQPAGNYFVAPILEYRREPYLVYSDSADGGAYRSTVSRAGLFVGAQLDNWGEVRAGLLLQHVDNGPQDPDAGLAEYELSHPVLAARLLIDRLDDVDFPTRGGALRLEWARAADDVVYDRVELTGVQATGRGTHTLLGALNAGTSLGTSLPLHDQFSLGGFLRLSGLAPRRLAGSYYGLARVVYLEQIRAGFDLIPAGAVRLGASVEAGNAWRTASEIDLGDLQYAGSLFAGVETPLGPLYLGHGRAEGGATSWYLLLGRVF